MKRNFKFKKEVKHVAKALARYNKLMPFGYTLRIKKVIPVRLDSQDVHVFEPIIQIAFINLKTKEYVTQTIVKGALSITDMLIDQLIDKAFAEFCLG